MQFKIGDRVRFRSEAFYRFKSAYMVMQGWKLDTVGTIDSESCGDWYDWYIVPKELLSGVHVSEKHIQNATGQMSLPFRWR